MTSYELYHIEERERRARQERYPAKQAEECRMEFRALRQPPIVQAVLNGSMDELIADLVK